MARDAWIQTLHARIEPVGKCREWGGGYMGPTPLVYCPRDYLYPASLQARHTVRTALWCLNHGCQAPRDQVIRTRCGNYRCVHEDHWLILSRKEQSRVQAKRGELQTVKAMTAKMRSARGRAKLTAADVAAIRASSVPPRVECLQYGVSYATISAVRSGRLWRTSVPGSSVFSPLALPVGGGA